MKNCIAIIDSGMGGLSLLKEFLTVLPHEKYIYFADLKNLPYGEKSKSQLKKITTKNIKFLEKKFKPKIIVFGCNTIGTTLFDEIRLNFKTKMFAIRPNIAEALDQNFQSILVLSTNKTTEKLKKSPEYRKNKNRIVLCKLKKLANKVEKYIQNPHNIVPYLKRALSKYKRVDCIVLGCTHYFFVKNQLKDIFQNAFFIDGTKILAKKVCDFLPQTKSKKLSKKSFSFKIKYVLTANKSQKNIYKKIVASFFQGKK